MRTEFRLTEYAYVCHGMPMADTHTYPGDELLTPGQAIAVAHISKSTLLRAEKAGKITGLRTPGGHRRYRRADVEALLTHPAA